jgi:hypothetical protein
MAYLKKVEALLDVGHRNKEVIDKKEDVKTMVNQWIAAIDNTDAS